MSAKFYTLLTDIGAAKLANAAALGVPLKITQMAVGDGGGVLPTPNAQQTKLVAEKRRAALNMLYIDPQNSSQIIAEQVIPETEGGWWIREVGLFDEAGALIAVGNCPESYKPQLAEGSGRTQTVRMVLITSSTDNITLKIDPAVVLATRRYVDDKVLELKVYVDELMAKHLAEADPHSQYATKDSPTFTGAPKAPTAAAGNNSTQLANTAFVQASILALIGGAPATLDTLKEIAAAINNDPNFSANINNALAQKAALNSPAFYGAPTAPTAAVGNNTQLLATTAFVQSAIASLVGSSPEALDTLNELAAALGNDPNFATTVTNAIAGKQPLDNTLSSLSGKSVSQLLQYLGLGDGQGRLINVQTFTASGTYTPTAGTKFVIAEVLGGGGGGGSNAATPSSGAAAGAGGASGAYAVCRHVPTGPVNVVIGSGGAGGIVTSGGADGSSGGTSSYGAVSAPGGRGGPRGLPFNVFPTGGNVANGSASVTGSVIVGTPGTSGSYGILYSDSNATGGGGANSIYGAGGVAITINSGGSGTTQGADASGYGAGGGGAVSVHTSTASSSRGGNGTAGIVIVWEYA